MLELDNDQDFLSGADDLDDFNDFCIADLTMEQRFQLILEKERIKHESKFIRNSLYNIMIGNKK